MSSSSSSSGDEIPDNLPLAEYMQMYNNVSKNSKHDPELTASIIADVEATMERDMEIMDRCPLRPDSPEAEPTISPISTPTSSTRHVVATPPPASLFKKKRVVATPPPASLFKKKKKRPVSPVVSLSDDSDAPAASTRLAQLIYKR